MTMTETTVLTPDLIAVLRERVTGRVIAPADDDWDEQRMPWHLVIDQQPAAVVHITSADDVVAAVRFAAEIGIPVTAQPRGHGATRALDSTILLRTGALDEVRLDIAAGTAWVGAGVGWNHLNQLLSGTGLSGLPGSSGDTTVVGYTLGGGVSWFGRTYGMAANHVRTIDLVTADGNRVLVTRESDPELFWALRGGGGEFGIVLAMELELVLAAPLYGGRMMWPVEHARAVLETFATVTDQAPDKLSLWFWLLNFPDLPMIPEPVRGRWMVAMDCTFLGTPEDADTLLAPLRAVAAPVSDTTGPLSLAALGTIAEEPEDPMPALLETVLLTRLDADVMDTLFDIARPGQPSPMLAFEIRHLGGAFAQDRDTDGAAGHLPEPYLLLYGGIVAVPELAGPITAGLAEIRAAMAPYVSGRTPANFTDDDRPGEVYPPEVLDRLRAIKHRRDPNGVIRGNRPFR